MASTLRHIQESKQHRLCHCTYNLPEQKAVQAEVGAKLETLLLLPLLSSSCGQISLDESWQCLQASHESTKQLLATSQH